MEAVQNKNEMQTYQIVKLPSSLELRYRERAARPFADGKFREPHSPNRTTTLTC